MSTFYYCFTNGASCTKMFVQLVFQYCYYNYFWPMQDFLLVGAAFDKFFLGIPTPGLSIVHLLFYIFNRLVCCKRSKYKIEPFLINIVVVK